MRNKTGGNKAKKKGRKNFRRKTYSLDDLIAIKGQEYGYVKEVCGDGRYKLICYDKVERLGITRGKIKKSSRIVLGSLVLVSLRDFEDAKCDILYQYTDDDIDKLLGSRRNIIDESFVKEGTLNSKDEDDYVSFAKSSNLLNINETNEEIDDESPWMDEDEINNKINSKVNEDEINIDDI